MSETMFYILFALRTERHGQVLGRVGQCSVFRMTLEDGGPATYRYVVDVQGRPRPDYLTTYQDFGWEHLGRTSNIHLWRRRTHGATGGCWTSGPGAPNRSPGRSSDSPGEAVPARRPRSGTSPDRRPGASSGTRSTAPPE